MEIISPENILKLLSKVCDLLSKNNIAYLVYGSVALNLYDGQNRRVSDIDIIIREADFEKITELLDDSFNPIQTSFTIHANSKEYLGYNNKPFDISFDSYEHYFQGMDIAISEATDREVEGVKIKIMPLDSLEKVYQKFKEV